MVDSNGAHVLLFPFPTAGHIIPVLDLANHLINHHLKLTLLVTPSNLPLLEPIQSKVQTLVLSFPQPPDSLDHSFAARVRASSELYNPIVRWFRSQASPPVAIISDFFLGWTHGLACQLGVRRIAFWPSGALTCLVMSHIWSNLEEILCNTNDNSLITFPNIPNSPEYRRWQVCTLSSQYKKGDPDWEFLRGVFLDNMKSWGVLFNSCEEVEGVFIDRVKEVMGHGRVWAVGPLLLPLENSLRFQRGGSSVVPVNEVMSWLDDKAENSVVYVSFGSRTTLTRQQTDALATALECSGVNFVWSTRNVEDMMITREYENRVANRGLIIKGWAPQVAILNHRAVGAFLTHCGWNSVLEGLSSKVLMLTWPMGADQFTSSNLLVDQLKVGIRVCEGGSQVVPDLVKLANILSESINEACSLKERMWKLHCAVSEAVQKGGSSRLDLHTFVKALCQLQCETII